MTMAAWLATLPCEIANLKTAGLSTLRRIRGFTRSDNRQSKIRNPKSTTFAIALILLCSVAVDAQQNKPRKIGWPSAVSGRTRGQEEIVSRLRDRPAGRATDQV